MPDPTALALTYLKAQSYNNAWSNHRLLSACRALTTEELECERVSFFPSILHTLNHNLTVDWFYVSALEGACVGYAAFEPEIPCREFSHLEREQRAVDQRLIDVCEALDSGGLGQPVDLVRASRVQVERNDRTLLHLFQHQIHHRGQVHAMLSGTRVAPPQLDEFFLGDERERELRRIDFEALGFDEGSIWSS